MRWYKIVVPDVIGSALIILDVIADVGFLYHLWNEEFKTLFWISVGFVLFAWIFVNWMAGVGIFEISQEMGSGDFEKLGLSWMWHKRTLLGVVYFFLGVLGLLPHLLLVINCIIIFKARREDDGTEEKLWSLMRSDNAIPAVKEVQSILDPGVMIYIKCIYFVCYATLYVENWPLFLGLGVNAVSLIFGRRKDFYQQRVFPYLALIVGVINCALRVAILVILGRFTSLWGFLLPLMTSVLLVFVWGLYLYFSLPLCFEPVENSLANAKPKNHLENAMSSFIYTLFLTPEDWHTAISILPYMATAIALAFLDIPVGLRALMPVAGTIGLLPSKFWWWVFIDRNE